MAIAEMESALRVYRDLNMTCKVIQVLWNQSSKLYRIGLKEGSAAAMWLAHDLEKRLEGDERAIIAPLECGKWLSKVVAEVAGGNAKELLDDLRRYAEDIRRRDVGRATTATAATRRRE